LFENCNSRAGAFMRYAPLAVRFVEQNGGGAVNTNETPSTPAGSDEWPEPTAEQLALIRRILAPRIRQARTERAEQQSAA
jgi:hypothetical protein